MLSVSTLQNMPIYYRYIIKLFIKIFSLNVLVLIGVLALVKLLTFINQNMVTGSISLYMAIKFITLSIPPLLIYISPIATLCTILYVYYMLSLESELVVLEATGLSRVALSKPAIVFGIGVALISFFLITIIAPLSKRNLNSYTTLMKDSSRITSILEEQAFNKISRNITLYMDRKDKDGLLHGVAIYQEAEGGSQIVILAKKAELLTKEGNFSFKLYDGSRQTIADENLQVLYFKTLSFNIPKSKILPDQRKTLNIEELTIVELILYKTTNQQDLNAKRAALNEMISWPILSLALAYIAACCIFSSNFERKWNVNKIINAVIFSVTYIAIIIFMDIKAKNDLIFIAVLHIMPILSIMICTHVLRKKSENKSVLPIKIYQKLPKNLKKLLS